MNMKKHITLAGNLIVDHIYEVNQYPEESQLVSIDRFYRSMGGAVANSGICLAKLDPNLQINAISVIGDDSDGEFILEQFDKYHNINHEQIVYGRANSSFTNVVFNKNKKTRTFFTYRGANAELSPLHFDFQKYQTDILHIGYILLLDTLDQEDSEYGTKMARVLHDAQQMGIKTSIDVVTESSNRFSMIVSPALKYTDYCIINEEEAGKTVGINPRKNNGNLDVEACHKICQKLFKLGVKEWVVIHAREGAIGMNRSGIISHKTSLKIKKEAIKGTTGAGDAFLAGVLYGVSQNYSIGQAIALGIATSGSSLLSEGSTESVRNEKETWNFYHAHEKEKWPGFVDDNQN